MTQAKRDELLRLPSSIVALETAIRGVLVQLGSTEFQNLKDAKDPKARVLIRIRLAKMKLYEAKVGIMVAQERWDRGGWGTNNQQGLKKTMTKKQLMFKQKWTLFKGQIDHYNGIIRGRGTKLKCPLLDEAKKLDFEDSFWSLGPLSHPSERWAVDAETRQMVLAALEIEQKLDELLARCHGEWEDDNQGKDLIDLVAPGQRISKDVWKVNVGVLRALHNNLRQHHCRTWMIWDADIAGLLRSTVKYTQSTTVQETEALINRWNGLVERGRKTWEHIVMAKSVQATALDDLEIVEQHMFFADEGEGHDGQPMDDIDLDDDESVVDDNENESGDESM
ncbi:uncharacterized protein MELLADRAFT_87493 [Melampsora larici-populina 98AG31]|uniref:Uncharacterized protein n=1 Tax=Melampsora larici-populina (strain 98AG31 / pathotype 3-4-7) TaxID=747676 RepID=F4RNH7_MELLP|nr:uncharacterized protein MELLADRAFT_87493 [Melampsora larici-populina 98AG31]EGG05991.1 hypothetical protein MELLADRAFT_87493 [Melampsora larici-populina 98AG31]